MPAYRAERTLGPTVADIPQGVAEQLILVDDASPDRTVERARDLGIRVFVHSRNRGYGGNQKSCYSIALERGADIVVLLHPDYQYDPKAVPLLIAPILAGDADMTFGSRFAGLSDPRAGGMPIYRFIGNRLTTVVENAIMGVRFTEMHSGMRAYTRSCLLSLPFMGYSDDYVFDSQLLVDAILSGQRVVEVPIPTRYTTESSSISVFRSLRYVSGTILYCARATWRKGRKGGRWPTAVPSLRRGPLLGHGVSTVAQCPLCSATVRVRVAPGLLQCLNCGLVSASGDTTPLRQPPAPSLSRFSALLARLRTFWLSGRTIAILGSVADRLAFAARDLGWTTDPIRTVEGLAGRTWDVVLFADLLADLADPVQALQKARASLVRDGMLAVFASDLLTPGKGGEMPPPSRRHLFSTAALLATLRRGGFQVIDWRRSTAGRQERHTAMDEVTVLCRRSTARSS